MARYRQEADQFLRVDLDPGFTGADARRDPGLIRTAHAFYDLNKELQGPGTASSAKNMRFAEGHAATRPGIFPPVSLNPSETVAADLVGSGLFSDPDGKEWLLLAAVGESNIFAVRDNETRKLLTVPEVPVAGEEWHIQQTFDGVIVLRGTSKNPWSWSGNFGSGFGEITVEGSPGFIDPLPPCEYGITAANRVWIIKDRDQVGVSDLLDYTAFDTDLNTLRINEGSDDKLVSLAPWRGSNIVVFKDQSIALLSGAVGDLSGLAASELNHEIGIAGKYAWATLGGDIVFLSADGSLYRLTEAIEGVKAVQEQALSEPMEPLFEEIDFENIHKATLAVHGRYLYCAIATTASTNGENNRTFVWDSITRQWCGYDYVSAEAGGTFDPRRFFQTDYLGQKRLVGVHYSGGTGGMVAVMEENLGSDWKYTSAGHAEVALPSYIKTRGYTFGEYGLSQARHLQVALDVWNASVTIKATQEGVNEEQTLLGPKTWSRTKYVTHATADWVSDNSNDDYANPKRESYHVLTTTTDGIQCQTNGFLLTGHQSHLERVRPLARDRWHAFSVESSQGSIKVKGISAEGMGAGPKERAYA